MYRLVRANVERHVIDEHACNILISEGYKIIEDEEKETQGLRSLNDLTIEELKELAEEEGIEIPLKTKKEVIIKLLEGGE